VQIGAFDVCSQVTTNLAGCHQTPLHANKAPRHTHDGGSGTELIHYSHAGGVNMQAAA
jgi:hypothetical protein